MFRGNSAAVCPLDVRVGDTVTQRIAAENNIPEIAIFVAHDDGYDRRRFTPTVVVDLCAAYAANRTP